MTATQLYNQALQSICTLTGIPADNVLHSKSEAATNARYLLIHTLASRLPDEKIAALLGITRQAANKARNQFTTRCRGRWELTQLYTDLQPLTEDQKHPF